MTVPRVRFATLGFVVKRRWRMSTAVGVPSSALAFVDRYRVRSAYGIRSGLARFTVAATGQIYLLHRPG